MLTVFVPNIYCNMQDYNIFPMTYKQKQFMDIEILDVKELDFSGVSQLSARWKIVCFE